MRKCEIESMIGLSYQSWLMRAEAERFAKLLRRMKKENPKTTVKEELLYETLLRVHILVQRLLDRRYFFNLEKTDYGQVADRDVDISTEDLKRKDREFNDWFLPLSKFELDILKVMLANSININLDTDVSQLFQALDRHPGNNGNRTEKPQTDRLL